jgi:flagellar biosynthesis protein
MKTPSPPTRAVALEYGDHAAPRVLVRAEGDLAPLLTRAAQELGIPQFRDDSLAEVLSHLPVREEIPEDLYVSVAVVMAWAYWVTGRVPRA